VLHSHIVLEDIPLRMLNSLTHLVLVDIPLRMMHNLTHLVLLDIPLRMLKNQTHLIKSITDLLMNWIPDSSNPSPIYSCLEQIFSFILNVPAKNYKDVCNICI
jgi:hypothetical protein